MHPTWLVYATGGVAWLGVEAQSTLTGSKAADTLTGWTVGGGTEIDWRCHMILFAEYLYTSFGSVSYSLDGVAERADFDGHLLRFGLKFKVGHDYFHDDYVRIVK
jgi:outer membrane immunogenic protein